METDEVKVTLASNDLKKLLELTDAKNNSDAVRKAVIYFLEDMNASPESGELKHGGHRKPGGKTD